MTEVTRDSGASPGAAVAEAEAPHSPWARRLKHLAASFFRLLYRAEIKGLENLPPEGTGAVLAANHVSYLDGPLLAAFLPRNPVFAVDSFVSRERWVKPWLALVDVCRIDPTNAFAMKGIIKAVRHGRLCVIFPEGRITETGSLMKVYEGPGVVAARAKAKIVPIRIDGPQYTPFSRMHGKLRLRWFPKITITILEPQEIGTGGSAGHRLFDILSETMFRTSNYRRTLFQAVLDARAVHGGRAIVLEDLDRSPIDFHRLVLGSLILGRKIAGFSEPGERVGVLLPTAAGAVVTFFALHAVGRIPAMLNFTAGAGAMASACHTAQVRTVLTSRRFVEKAELHDTVARLSENVKIVYLEDVRASVGTFEKIRGLLASRFARSSASRFKLSPDAEAVVLFTSGSEGVPKGVLLSHANLLANCAQVASRIDFTPQDIVFNALPLFHSLGLMGGTILPLVNGLKTFLYPSPLHYRTIPEAVYAANATVLFGTDTFLTGYARNAHPYDFFRLRFVVAGAERVREETRRVWFEKFGIRILEGYGVTETAPVLAVNTPLELKLGTVGRLLPGMEWRLDPVPGIDAGGRLVVRGPNVMTGYLQPGGAGIVQAPPDGWHDTGDIVDVDDAGYITIRGRAKRFAKIAGEMVSLNVAESLAASAWPDDQHAAVTQADGRRGEQIILLTTRRQASRERLWGEARARGVTDLAVPKTVLVVDNIPVLGSGKTNYPVVSTMAADLLENRQAGTRA